MTTAVIEGVGAYVPQNCVTNHELAKVMDTSDEWIRSRTGIEKRHILKGEGKGVSQMAIPAVKELIAKRDIDPAEIDLIICATVTSDYHFPSTANLIAHEIGAKNSFGFDLSAACSGFLFALDVGHKYVASGAAKKVVVVGADKMSAIVNYKDRNTCVLFGDAAGAVLLEPHEQYGIEDSILKVDGTGSKYLYQKAGGSAYPASNETVERGDHFIYQEGKTVFKYAVKGMADVSHEIMEKNKLSSDDIKYLVPHQANIRIIEATANRMGISMDKVMVNIQKYGNTTAATIPLCLYDWESQLKQGDKLIMAAFGGGFTWGATYLTWAYPH